MEYITSIKNLSDNVSRNFAVENLSLGIPTEKGRDTQNPSINKLKDTFSGMKHARSII